MPRPSRALAAIAPLVAVALLAPIPAAAGKTGSWWEMTMQVEMKGMPFAMPPTTTKVCSEDEQPSEPPPDKENNCRHYDFKRSGNRVTFKIACEGREKMTGDADFTWSPSTSSGTMNMHTGHGDMAMKFTGKKVGPACNPDAERQQLQARAEQGRAEGERMRVEAQENVRRHERAQADQCLKNADLVQVDMFVRYGQCKDEASKARFCQKFQSREGLRLASGFSRQGRGDGVQEAARFCNVNLGVLVPSLCPEAVQFLDLRYIGPNCPAEGQRLAQQHCAGRDYTSVDERFREFCTTYAAGMMQGNQGKRRGPRDPGNEAVDQGKKLLRGLGF